MIIIKSHLYLEKFNRSIDSPFKRNLIVYDRSRAISYSFKYYSRKLFFDMTNKMRRSNHNIK